MIDAFGREIRVGDRIVYAGRYGSSQWLTTGVVTGFKEKKSEWSNKVEEQLVITVDGNSGYGGPDKGRQATLTQMRTCMVIGWE